MRELSKVPLVSAFFPFPLRSRQIALVAVVVSPRIKLCEFPASRFRTIPLETISFVFNKVGGAEMIISSGMLTLADTESVTVNVSAQLPTVAVSAIFRTATPAVLVSKVIPGMTGLNVAR